MTFLHDDPDWPDLLQIVAADRAIQVGMVEKDYWVTHVLWAIHEQGFEVWFKGGTSLSKGFDLIERISEDIDVRIDAGTVPGLVNPRLSWRNRKRGPSERDTWFRSLGDAFAITSCSVTRDATVDDPLVRAAKYEVVYPSLHASVLPAAMRPFVLLEVGRARVVPFVERSLSSWVHDHADRAGLDGFADNRPTAVRCIHPWVTCLEKLDAIARRYDQGKAAPDFIRHYEDVARILEAWHGLPALDGGLPQLVADLATEDKKTMPAVDHPAFVAASDDRWAELERAWTDIEPMFWGPRHTLAQALDVIRPFLTRLPDPPLGP